MKPPLKKGNADDFQTPKEALYPLLPYLKKEWNIWEPAEGKGNLTKELKRLKFNVIGTDILTGTDFLKENSITKNLDKIDCIITNPPYSLKQEFLERCYELKKPFALLLPLTALETKKRQGLFKKYGVEIIFFDKRINFETPSGRGSGSWFVVAWFTSKLNIGKELNFVHLKDLKQKELSQNIVNFINKKS